MGVRIDTNNELACLKAWINIVNGNSAGYTPAQIGAIKGAYSDQIADWTKYAKEVDATDYDLTDEELSNYIEDGKDAASEACGHDGSKPSFYRTAADCVGGAGSALTSYAGNFGVGDSLVQNSACNAASKATGKVLGKASEATNDVVDAALTAGDKAESKVTEAAGNKGWIISIPLAVATALSYVLKKPNQEEHKAAQELCAVMKGNQQALVDTQNEMAQISDEVEELSNDAIQKNEEGNQKINEEKTDYEFYKKSKEELDKKIDRKEALSPSEKDLYKTCVEYMSKAGENIEKTSEETSQEVSAKHDEINGYQSDYDDALVSMGEIKGTTEFAAGFDKSTQNHCYAEAAAQGLSAVGATKSTIQATKFAMSGGLYTAWAWAFVIAGGGAAVGSGLGAYEQFKMAGDVGAEIKERETTEAFNDSTMEVFNTEFDNYTASVSNFETLELTTPKDIDDNVDNKLAENAKNEENAKKKQKEQNNQNLA